MENNRISTYAMLQNIVSKLGLREVYDLPFRDIMSWMMEALAHIGGYTALETITKKVKVVNYTGKYPRDLYAIKRVIDHPNFRQVRGGFQISETDVEVTIEYDRFPLDDNGFPLYPNDPSTKDAIMWYVAQFLAIQDKLPTAKLTPQYCDRQWQWYCGQARAEGFVPSIDQWNRMVNIFYRLIPEKDEYERYFEGLNSAEGLNLDPLNSNNSYSNNI
ncbi:hypothetical protein [Tenacibaculum sp.]|uniref:hypothetical protein n=1 Tax=Tenacibaculum sp. TaxID=1906242 RepID=UPI003D0FBE5A